MNPPPNLFPENEEDKIVWFRRRLKQLKSRQRNWAFVVATSVTAFCFIGFVWGLRGMTDVAAILGVTGIVFLLSLLSPLGWKRGESARSRIEAHWRQAIGENYDLPLDLLIEAVRILPFDLNAQAHTLLLRRLTSECIAEYQSLSSVDKRFLIHELWQGGKGQQQLLMYLAEHYGGEEMLPRLQHILKFGETKSVATGVRFYDEERVTAAKRILPIVETRVEAMKRGETLLRPSVAPPPDLYLRPSEETPNPDDEAQLLRASVDENEG